MTKHPYLRTALLAALTGPTVASAQAVPMTVTEESVFAVVTYKGGLAGGLAHNHFVVADRFLADFAYDAEDPTASTLRFSTLVDDLIVDDPTLQAAWIDRMHTLTLVDEFGDLDEGDRRKVREEMLDEDQLDPESHPLIAATVTSIERADSRMGTVSFPYLANVEVTIHGTTVSRGVPVRHGLDGETLVVEGVGHFTFTEFGIEPYSAFLGTVKVRNEFVIYINLRARPTSPTG